MVSSRRGYLKWVIAAVLVALASLVGHRLFFRSRPVRVASVAMGTIQTEIRGPGTVQARTTVQVASRIPGVVSRVLVDIGDRIETGQLLVVLDDADQQARVAGARASVAAAGRNRVLAETSERRSRAELDLARADHDRDRLLVRSGHITRAAFDVAVVRLRVADSADRGAKATIALRKAEAARLRHELELAEVNAGHARIAAPMSGLVVRRMAEPGSSVGPGTPLVQIVDHRTLWVTTLVDESQVGSVRVGDAARIQLRSGARLRGKVARIALLSDPVTRELEVDVAFDRPPARFAINEEAAVTILGEKTSGLSLPLEALTLQAGRDAVFVVERDRARPTPVRLSAVGTGRAVVAEGLRAGDRVVLQPGALRGGERVRAVAEGG